MCTREFKLHYKESDMEISLFAGPLDIFLMKGKFQWEFQHSIPPQHQHEMGPRINFTFRSIVRHSDECVQN